MTKFIINLSDRLDFTSGFDELPINEYHSFAMEKMMIGFIVVVLIVLSVILGLQILLLNRLKKTRKEIRDMDDKFKVVNEALTGLEDAIVKETGEVKTALGELQTEIANLKDKGADTEQLENLVSRITQATENIDGIHVPKVGSSEGLPETETPDNPAEEEETEGSDSATDEQPDAPEVPAEDPPKVPEEEGTEPETPADEGSDEEADEATTDDLSGETETDAPSEGGEGSVM